MNAHFYEKDGKVWFHLDRPSIADRDAKPFEFDGLAEATHKERYPSQWKDFQKSKEVVPAPVVEESPVKTGIFGKRKKSA